MATMATITVYDDPLNPHGWALQPALRRIRLSFPSIEWRVRPVPLADDWETYDGPEIRGGTQGIPATCAQVSESSGMPIDEYLWFDDPPRSSLPGCRLVALAAEREVTVEDAPVDGATAAMRAVREATFVRRVNVTTEAGLDDVIDRSPVLDAAAVRSGLADGTADAALETHGDLDDADVPGVRTTGDRPELPTVVVSDGDDARGHSGRGKYPRYAQLVERVTGSSPEEESVDVSAVVSQFSPKGWIAVTELSELTDTPYDEAVAATRDLAEVTEREFAGEPFFRASEHVSGDPGESTREDESGTRAVSDGSEG